MKKAITLFFCWQVLICQAQKIDSADSLATVYLKEAEFAAKNQKLWPVKLYGPTLLVDQQSRIAYANMPDSAGVMKKDGEIYKGRLPKEVMVANTAVNWQGTLWSVILWPLPQEHDDRLNLMMHESFHRVQNILRLPAHSPTADHLSSLNGRIYFLLELQALKAALTKPVNQRRPDLANALLFRAKRQELFPQSFPNERVLEINEGLAEYTGVMLGRSKDSVKQHLYSVITHAAGQKSLIRSFAYITGPVYGYLLYQKNPEWTLKVDSNASFVALIESYYHVHPPDKPVGTKILAYIDQYDGKTIIISEKLKDKEHQKIFSNYVAAFTKQPVLVIKLKNMHIVFNPNNLFDLGEYGTIYPTAEIKDAWGQLTVTGGGVLMKDWSIITLPAGEGISQDGGIIQGRGWKITLQDSWKLVKNDSLHFALASSK